jgi:hypothetical protein
MSNIPADNGSSLKALMIKLATRFIISFQAISVIRGARYGVFTNKKHALNTLKMASLLRSDVMLS